MNLNLVLNFSLCLWMSMPFLSHPLRGEEADE